jgi:hypothetical protein
MVSNSIVQHRAKQINLLFTRELSLIEREHSQNVITHQKLENSLRRASDQFSDPTQMKISIPFKQIYNEQKGCLDYHQIRDSNINSIHKYRLSFGAASIINSMNPNQTNFDRSDEFSDDALSSYISFRRRRFCTKPQRLPPIIKPKRENKSPNWTPSPPETHRAKEDQFKQFTPINDEVSSPIPPPELAPIDRQVRSFLESLPTYKGVQDGFDSFAPASLYTIRTPILIR